MQHNDTGNIGLDVASRRSIFRYLEYLSGDLFYYYEETWGIVIGYRKPWVSYIRYKIYWVPYII